MRVAIAHPDRLVREALRRTLAGGSLKLIWSAADRSELARFGRRDPAELLLLDASMVGPAAEALREQPSACLVLASDDATPGVFEALSAGALGHRPRLVSGDPENFKLTWPGDFALAERLLATRMTPSS